mgnify:CR=1 FL=1
MPSPTPAHTKLPAAIWVLGFVSLLMDVSSELIHSLLPVFMVSVLGASMLTVGLIEGAAEATALIVKVFAGALSDWWGKRKPLALMGYSLGALTKPMFALATGMGMVVAARMIDRVGKGIRGTPRDALVADIAPPEARGAAFGLRQSLDTVGAFLGPLLAMLLMLLWANDIRAVFWAAVVPAALCVALLAWGVQEPERAPQERRTNPIRRDNLRHLPTAFWSVVALGAVFTLARFSEAFLVLRLQQDGLPLAFTPLVLIAMNLVYALGAYPLGKLSDGMDHGRLLAWGLVPLVAENRILVRRGLELIANTSRPGLRALKEVAGLDGFVQTHHLGFRIGPRLNAAGRLDTALTSLNVLLASDHTDAMQGAQMLDQHNRERQTVENTVFKEAEAMLQTLGSLDDLPSIVLGSRDWHPGVVGIVASRVSRMCHRPAILIAIDEGGMGKIGRASCRERVSSPV